MERPGRARRALVALAATGWLTGLAGLAAAATADGVLVTAVACATFRTVNPYTQFTASYCVTGAALVANPRLLASKTVTPSIESSGATLTYCIWVANTSDYTSAFNAHVEDIIPGTSGVMSYVQGQSNWISGTAGATLTIGYGGRPPHNTFLTQYWGSEMPAGQSGPYAIRWVISVIGPGKSAMLCWKASIL